MFGFPRLAKLAAEGKSGQELIDLLLNELAKFTGPDWEQEDDITLVTLRRSSGGPAAATALTEFELASEPGNERIAIDRVAAAVGELDLPPARLERLKTAVGEAVMNAIEHGNHNRPELPVGVRVARSGSELSVRVTDQGGDQAVLHAEQPDLEAKLAGEQSPRGWGLFLIESMVDELRTSADERHHAVELIVRLEGVEDHG
jgi:anti-sigma regulatory factor (Ser/Thr protein kinase)